MDITPADIAAFNDAQRAELTARASASGTASGVVAEVAMLGAGIRHVVESVHGRVPDPEVYLISSAVLVAFVASMGDYPVTLETKIMLEVFAVALADLADGVALTDMPPMVTTE